MGKIPTLYIFGPTAVGKTDFVERLAAHIPAEIVNMDVGQFYTPLSIGTAKPDWSHSTIPHHFFDILDDPRNLTVVEYRQRLQETIAAIHDRQRIALVVGGSAFYLTSLLFPLQHVITNVMPSDSTDDSIDTQNLWQHLHTIDPERAQGIHPSDIYRVRRALAIWHTTGTKPSHYSPQFAPCAPFMLLGLTRDRQELYQRINNRVAHMMEQGWLDEVTRLRGTAWDLFLREKKLIGYPELLAYLDHPESVPLHEVVADVQQKTRHYAKRQLTFWRRLQRLLAQVTHGHNFIRGIHELNLTHSDDDLYIKQLSLALSEWLKKRTSGDL